MKPKIESDVFWQKGDGQKPPWTTFQTKKPKRKPSWTKTNPTVTTYACMHVLLKIGGPRCVTYLRGSRDVWQGGGQNWFKIAWHTLWTVPYPFASNAHTFCKVSFITAKDPLTSTAKTFCILYIWSNLLSSMWTTTTICMLIITYLVRL